MLICSMVSYLDCLNLLLALFSQFRLKILKAGVIQLSGCAQLHQIYSQVHSLLRILQTPCTTAHVGRCTHSAKVPPLGSTCHSPGDHERRPVHTVPLLLGWRMRQEAGTIMSGNSLLRTGLAYAEGVCSLQNPPLSFPQTQEEAQSTIPGSALLACCTVLAPALSRQVTTPCQRSCSFLRDEPSSFLELPEMCH